MFHVKHGYCIGRQGLCRATTRFPAVDPDPIADKREIEERERERAKEREI